MFCIPLDKVSCSTGFIRSRNSPTQIALARRGCDADVSQRQPIHCPYYDCSTFIRTKQGNDRDTINEEAIMQEERENTRMCCHGLTSWTANF